MSSIKIMSGESIVILSSDDWGWKTSKYQLSTRFANHNKVLFVSSVGFRSATASRQDFSRIFSKLRKFIKGVESVAPSLYVLTPLVIPLRTSPLIAILNRLFLKLQIAYFLRKLDIERPYVLVFSQNWLDVAKSIDSKKLVYYCVDEHSGFRGIDSERFIKDDREMARLADVVVCSSRRLLCQKKVMNRNTRYIPHGVNYALFSRAVNDPALRPPADITQVSGPILGFYGHVSYEWVDAELLKFVASERPEYTIVLIGKYSMAADEFSGCNNVLVIGEREHEELPAYSKAFSVGIIPFVKSVLTDNCNPLKLYEYLAAGLPVVSTEIPEVCAYQGDVRIGRDYQEFVRACDSAVQQEDLSVKKQRSVTLQNATWDDRVAEIYELLRG